MWKDGLTQNTLEVFERISKLEFLKDFHLCGGTGIALQLNHRFSEDLDFELLSLQGKSDKQKELEHGKIIAELKAEFGTVQNEKVLTSDHFDCFVGDGVKLSFYKPKYKVPVLNEVNILNNIKTVSLQDALGMKLYVVNIRNTFRDYYDIYSLLKEGYSLKEGIQYALNFSRHDISSGNLIKKLLSEDEFKEKSKEGRFKFNELRAKYEVDTAQICDLIRTELSKISIKKNKIDLTAYKSIGRLFYETFIKLDGNQLSFVLGKLPDYRKSKTEEGKIEFLNNLLTSVGVNVVPYSSCKDDIYDLRRKKDIESLSRIEGTLSEYESYNLTNSEIKKQSSAIKRIQILQIDSSTKETLTNNCKNTIESLKKRQQALRYYQEFQRAEDEKGKSQKREPLDYSEENLEEEDKQKKNISL